MYDQRAGSEFTFMFSHARLRTRWKRTRDGTVQSKKLVIQRVLTAQRSGVNAHTSETDL